MTYLLFLISIGLIAALSLTFKSLQNQRYQTFIAEQKLVESNKKIKSVQQKHNAFVVREKLLKQSDIQIEILRDQLHFSQQQLENLQARLSSETLETNKNKADHENINKLMLEDSNSTQEANLEIEALNQEARCLKQKAEKESEDVKKQAKQEIEVLRQEADREVECLKQKAEREIESLRQKYKQKSEASKREIQQFKQNAKQEIEDLRQEVELEVELLREESNQLRQNIKEKSEELSQITNDLCEILENKVEEESKKSVERSRGKESFNRSSRIEAQNMPTTNLFISQEDGIIFQSLEKDFYPQERREIIIATLRYSRENIRQNSRSRHIIDDIISNNIYSDNRKAIKTKVQNLFRNYTRMNSRTKKSLKDMGFEIVSEKNHYKIVFYGDNRYTVSLSKTPSDWRTGRNIARDICNLLL